MLKASKALRKAASTGKALPGVAPLSALEALGVRLRAGQVSMVTGRPKAGKSNLAQWWATIMQVPTLYYSLDMDAFTASIRQAAILTGHDQSEISKRIEEDGPESWFYEGELAEVKIQYCFDTAPALAEMGEELDAYVELWDEYPELIVVDNLLNIEGTLEDHRAQKFALLELQALARRTAAHVMVLHHATESGVKDTSWPPRLSDTDGKVNQIPELVLSVANDPDQQVFRIAALAVRNGKSDPEARHPISLYAAFNTMQFNNVRPTQWAASTGYAEGYDY